MTGSPATAAVLAHPAFARVKDLVIERTGLAYYLDKDAALAERVRRRLDALALADVGAYAGLLAGGGAGAGEFQALIDEITVGETFFFRYREQFEALRAVVVPECLRRNAASRTLRVWSAGCSTGAEPYSVEILLRRHFAVELEGWQVSIIGTDINRGFLRQANDGVYGDWALRGVTPDVRAACFDPGPAGTRVLKPEFRRWTRFGYFNLSTGTLPSWTDGLAGFDIVLCRNVMIYFDEATRLRLIRGLHDVIADGGWLFVGHAEAGLELTSPFISVAVPGATLYRKPPQVPVAMPTPVAGPEAREATPPAAAPQPAPARPVTSPEEPSPPPPAAADLPAPGDAVPTLDDLVALADRGDWTAALDACEALVDAVPTSAAAHFYRGLIEDHLGVGDPGAAFRRALYLDQGLALAHYHLALVHWRRGQMEPARRHFRNARLALVGHDPGESVAFGRGLSVRELAAMLDLWLPGRGGRGGAP
ncbi:CheR family methyltransferase [Azospirillum halopraeferens]|uniref:CheR family methyltransferase n=1 Tax=Azospirillum halopraeferens TaxID=34010 RepID=UPI000419A291|nr:protein-glutamate O-methyltransferase CheR [Azospirillum halopraeferens]